MGWDRTYWALAFICFSFVLFWLRVLYNINLATLSFQSTLKSLMLSYRRARLVTSLVFFVCAQSARHYYDTTQLGLIVFLLQFHRHLKQTGRCDKAHMWTQAATSTHIPAIEKSMFVRSWQDGISTRGIRTTIRYMYKYVEVFLSVCCSSFFPSHRLYGP